MSKGHDSQSTIPEVGGKLMIIYEHDQNREHALTATAVAKFGVTWFMGLCSHRSERTIYLGCLFLTGEIKHPVYLQLGSLQRH